MFARFRRCVLLLLLMTVPLQGMASAMHALACAPHDEQAAGASDHDHAAHGHGTTQPDESGAAGPVAGDHASHQCCHHFSAAPVSAPATGATDHDVLHSSVAPLELSFMPEQPQRPPRA